MVEIALSLAIIGFALVAILGVLPIGVTTQRDNREDTIINHDAALWMDALRSGPWGVSVGEDLSTYLVTITKTVVSASATNALIYTNLLWPQAIGLLSTPSYESPNATTLVSADVRAMTGSAVSRAPQNNAVINEAAFTYRLTATVGNASAASLVDLQEHLYDVRLEFRWPVLPNGKTGLGHRTYRSSFGGTLLGTSVIVNGSPVVLWFFQPTTY
jgi:hypothetical protein